MREILFKAKRLDNGEVEGTILTFVKELTPSKGLFLCECGSHTEQYYSNILNGRVKSCGCLRYKNLSKRNTKHGESGTRLYRIWRGIKTRCQNPNHGDYANYGARGIKVCNEWNCSFAAFKEWALANGYNDNLTIERMDVNGDYCPENCTWITKGQQVKNQRPKHMKCERDSKGRFTKVEYIFDNPELLEVTG